MKQKTNLFLIVICFILTGCNKQGGDNSDEPSELLVIDIEQSFQTEQQMLISDIADSVEYIELKAPNDIVIARVWDIKQFNDYLIIQSRLEVYLFHKNGQFIRQIGSCGQGPGEYTVVCDFCVDYQNREIIIADTRQLLYYDLDGNFLRSIKRNIASIYIGISDSILWIGKEIESTSEKCKAVAISSTGEGDTLAYISNPLFGTKSDALVKNTTPFMSFFYYKNNVLFFKGDELNDTIWKLSGIHAEPYALMNLGKYKMPIEHEAWLSSSTDIHHQHLEKYWDVNSIVEDERYFFLLSQNRKYSKKNRQLKYVVYDKKISSGFAAKDENGMGLTDDILGGPPIWPRWSSNEYYISTTTADELLEKVETGNLTPTASLKELLSRINVYSNDLIILCRKKK